MTKEKITLTTKELAQTLSIGHRICEALKNKSWVVLVDESPIKNTHYLETADDVPDYLKDEGCITCLDNIIQINTPEGRFDTLGGVWIYIEELEDNKHAVRPILKANEVWSDTDGLHWKESAYLVKIGTNYPPNYTFTAMDNIRIARFSHQFHIENVECEFAKYGNVGDFLWFVRDNDIDLYNVKAIPERFYIRLEIGGKEVKLPLKELAKYLH